MHDIHSFIFFIHFFTHSNNCRPSKKACTPFCTLIYSFTFFIAQSLVVTLVFGCLPLVSWSLPSPNAFCYRFPKIEWWCAAIYLWCDDFYPKRLDIKSIFIWYKPPAIELLPADCSTVISKLIVIIMCIISKNCLYHFSWIHYLKKWKPLR